MLKRIVMALALSCALAGTVAAQSLPSPSFKKLTLPSTDQGSTGSLSGMTAGGLLLGDKLPERKSLLDFVTDSTVSGMTASAVRAAITAGTLPNTVDLSSVLQAAGAYLTAGYGRLVIPGGVYPYSTFPNNWAVQHARVACEGDVRFRYTGTGNAVILDAGPVTGSGATLSAPQVYDIDLCFSNPLIVEAPSTALNGVYMRAIHHTKLGVNVRGAGSNSAGLYSEFGVANEIRLTVSVNEGGWYANAKPRYGAIFDARPGNPNDYSAGSYIRVYPVIEGVGFGMSLRTTLGMVLVGGTIEACSEYGLDMQTGTTNAIIDHVDFEANNGFDIRDNGTSNTILNVNTLARSLTNQATSGVIIGATAVNSKIDGGAHNTVSVVSGANGTLLTGFGLNRLGDGALSNNGTATRGRNIYNIIGKSWIADF